MELVSYIKIYAQLHKFFQFISLEYSQTGVSAATDHLSNGVARWTSDTDTRSSALSFKYSDTSANENNSFRNHIR